MCESYCSWLLLSEIKKKKRKIKVQKAQKDCKEKVQFKYTQIRLMILATKYGGIGVRFDSISEYFLNQSRRNKFHKCK